jgi:S1-C subfamily serine protease
VRFLVILCLFLSSCFQSTISPTAVVVEHREKLYRVHVGEHFIGTAFSLKTEKGVYLFTAGHVCDVLLLDEVKSMTQTAVSSSGQQIPLDHILISSEHDVCVLNKLSDSAPHFVLAEENQIEDAWVLGFPAGRALSATFGSIVGEGSAKIPMPEKKKENCDTGAYKWEKVQIYFFEVEMCVAHFTSFDTTIAGAPGSSGGPVVRGSETNEIVGVVSYSDTSTPGFISSVPVSEIKKIIQDI